MLIGIDPLLGPELLSILRAMGHGDELVIADANFPAHSVAQRLVRLDGTDANTALTAILSVMPLDSYVDAPVHTMEVVGDARQVPDAVADFRETVRSVAPIVECATLERFAFYERAKHAFAIVATSERRLYGNVLLTKGVIETEAGA